MHLQRLHPVFGRLYLPASLCDQEPVVSVQIAAANRLHMALCPDMAASYLTAACDYGELQFIDTVCEPRLSLTPFAADVVCRSTGWGYGGFACECFSRCDIRCTGRVRI